ncbi:unnamed protein product, partial [Pneumocystis jirovecii]
GVRDGTSHEQQEAHYIKQKISQILSKIPTARNISLNTILDLIEDVFQSNDNSHLSKMPTLSVGIISILCSSNVLKTIYPNDLPNPLKIRENNLGWLNIFKKSIESYFNIINASSFPKISETDIIHILNCLKSCLFWIPTEQEQLFL